MWNQYQDASGDWQAMSCQATPPIAYSGHAYCRSIKLPDVLHPHHLLLFGFVELVCNGSIEFYKPGLPGMYGLGMLQVKGVLDTIDPSLMKEVLDGPYLMAENAGGNLDKQGLFKTNTQVVPFWTISGLSHQHGYG
jgi:hypothetical protein